MSIGNGTHWKGPLRSGDQAGGGLLEDIPADVLAHREESVYFNDFLNADRHLNLTTEWEAVDVGTVTVDPSTFIRAGVANGVLRMIADATDGDGNSLQATFPTGGVEGNALVPLAASDPDPARSIVFEVKVTHSDWDDNHWFFGIMEDAAGTAVLDTNGDMAGSLEYLGFHHNGDDDGDGIPRLVLAGGNNTPETAAAGTGSSSSAIAAPTDASSRRFGVRLTGTDGCEWFVDGKRVARATAASAFTAPLYIAFGAVNNGAVADTVDIDWVLASQTRIT